MRTVDRRLQLVKMSQTILFVGVANVDGSVRRHLEQKGFSSSATDSLERAADLLTGSRVDALIINLELEGGIDFIIRMRSISMRTPVLAVGEWGTGHPTVALSAGADAYEPWPIDAGRLADALERILNKRAAVVGMNE